MWRRSNKTTNVMTFCVRQNCSFFPTQPKKIFSQKLKPNITTETIYFPICENLQRQQGLNQVHVWISFVRIGASAGLACYYGKWATELTSKPAALTFISPWLAQIQIQIFWILTSKIIWHDWLQSRSNFAPFLSELKLKHSSVCPELLTCCTVLCKASKTYLSIHTVCV